MEIKNVGSYLTGKLTGRILKKYPKDISDFLSNSSSKAFEVGIDYLGTSDFSKDINSISSVLYKSTYRGIYAPKFMERKYSNLVSQYYFGIDIK